VGDLFVGKVCGNTSKTNKGIIPRFFYCKKPQAMKEDDFLK
jgi:hypothetical protein